MKVLAQQIIGITLSSSFLILTLILIFFPMALFPSIILIISSIAIALILMFFLSRVTLGPHLIIIIDSYQKNEFVKMIKSHFPTSFVSSPNYSFKDLILEMGRIDGTILELSIYIKQDRLEILIKHEENDIEQIWSMLTEINKLLNLERIDHELQKFWIK